MRNKRSVFATMCDNYNGFSGQKSFGEQLNNFAISLRCDVLYLVRKLGLST